MRLPARFALALLIALCALALIAPTASATPAEDVRNLNGFLDQANAALDRGDLAAARASMAQFNSGWAQIEDGVRGLSRSSYRSIEKAQGDVNFALGATTPDPQAVRASLQQLHAETDGFVLSFEGAAAPTPRPATDTASSSAAASNTRTLDSVVQHLATASARIDASDVAGARSEVDAFAREWTDVEGAVKAKSAAVYTSTENNTARARALLQQSPPDTAAAREVLQTMQNDLAPIVQSSGTYTAFDAAAILLREGLEALLVIGALLAFLNRSGNGDKARWIWVGGGAALVASVGVAVLVNVVFAQAAAGANRELLEGATGLVAAGLLLYVSHWLHSKSSLGGWQRYVHSRGTAALARNSVLSLSLLAFLAVFREGAETVLFYVGIAPAIAMGDLALGLGVATALLVVFGVLILVVGVKLPLRPFFLVTSLLIYYMAFKFIGAGIHALQVSGYLPATPRPFLPSSDVIGMFPTLETTAAQVLLLMATGLVLLLPRLRRPSARQPEPA